MKKAVIYVTLGCALALGGLQLGAVPASTMTLTGEVIDIASYAMKDARGEEFAEGGRFRADHGFPIGILTDDGDVWVAVFKNPAPASPLETANKLLVELMGKQVVVRGETYKAAGVNVIRIAIASEM